MVEMPSADGEFNRPWLSVTSSPPSTLQRSTKGNIPFPGLPEPLTVDTVQQRLERTMEHQELDSFNLHPFSAN